MKYNSACCYFPCKENAENHCMTDGPNLQAIKSFNLSWRNPYEFHIKRWVYSRAEAEAICRVMASLQYTVIHFRVKEGGDRHGLRYTSDMSVRLSNDVTNIYLLPTPPQKKRFLKDYVSIEQ